MDNVFDTNSCMTGIDDAYKSYINAILQFDLLTPEEELELAKRMSAGDKAAREKFINSNLRLVVDIAYGYKKHCFDLDLLDLIQEGNAGLIVAANRFDYTRGTKFSTYATHWIRQHMSRAIANKGTAIRLPVHVMDKLKKINAVKNWLEANNTVPTSKLISELTAYPEKLIDELLNLSKSPISLDAPRTIGDAEEENITSLNNLVPDKKDFVEELFEDDFVESFDIFFSNLTEKERRVIDLRFGIRNGYPKTLKEVGNELGITRERARQLEKKALNKMKFSEYIMENYPERYPKASEKKSMSAFVENQEQFI